MDSGVNRTFHPGDVRLRAVAGRRLAVGVGPGWVPVAGFFPTRDEPALERLAGVV
jgi:hypothetical protein